MYRFLFVKIEAIVPDVGTIPVAGIVAISSRPEPAWNDLEITREGLLILGIGL